MPDLQNLDPRKEINNDSICFAFTGEAVKGGRMDALLFAQSLEAFRNLAIEANRVINGDSVEITIEITANFEDGSFEWVVNTKEKALAITKDLWEGDTINKIASVCTILGFCGVVIHGGVSLIDFLLSSEGKKVELIEPAAGSQTIKVKCENKKIEIPVEIFKLQEDLPVRRNLESFVRPICQKGIDGLEVRKEKTTIKRIEAKDYYFLKAPDIKQEIETYEYTGVFTIVSPHMLHGNKWRLIDEETRVERTFEISDKQFLDDVFYKRYAFKSGDKLQALVKVTIFETKRGQELRYELLEMQAYISSDTYNL